MKKNLFFVGALMMASLSMMAQTKNGGMNQTYAPADGEKPDWRCDQQGFV